MSLMAIVAAGQQGRLFEALAVLLEVDEPVARSAIEHLSAAVAARMMRRAADPGEQDMLLDVVASGDFQRYLDDPRALFGRDAVRDGEEALVYLYGSVEAARDNARSIGPPAGLDSDVFARLMTLAASLVLAAMARRLDQMARDRSAAAGPTGRVAWMGRVILRGVSDGTVRTLFRRARFARRMALRRLMPRRRRLSGRPSLEALLGDLAR